MSSPLPKSKRPTPLSKLEGHSDTVNDALLVPGEDAVISVSDDKYVDLPSCKLARTSQKR